MFDAGIKINFAWQSFEWKNETYNKLNIAHVYCVIVGFAMFDRAKKIIFDRAQKIIAKNINGYLLDAPNVFIQGRVKMLTDGLPEMTKGSQPTDGGNLIIENEDLNAFIKKDSRSKKYIRRYMMGEEFVKNLPRWCLWLIDANPTEIQSIKPIFNRVKKCKKFRATSQTESVSDFTPSLFTQIRQPLENYIAIPEVSSSARKYIPMGFLSPDIIAGNNLRIIPGGNIYLFGILESIVHMAWTRVVAGRFGTGYRYSPMIYHNFPFPNPTDKQKLKIEKTAQKILDVRSKYTDSSLSDLYDSSAMPHDLRRAHVENDRAVLEAYEFEKDLTESEIVSKLFEMYQTKTNEGD